MKIHFWSSRKEPTGELYFYNTALSLCMPNSPHGRTIRTKEPNKVSCLKCLEILKKMEVTP
jgi:hypothetical protein